MYTVRPGDLRGTSREISCQASAWHVRADVSEPKAIAHETVEIVPGLWCWAVEDERIGGFFSAAHAFAAEEGVVLVDPLPLETSALAALGEPAAICLTSGSHQRSAWRLRRELGLRVYAPALVKEVEEEPDVRYRKGDVLPGGLKAIFAPGPGTTQHALRRLVDSGLAMYGPRKGPRYTYMRAELGSGSGVNFRDERGEASRRRGVEASSDQHGGASTAGAVEASGRLRFEQVAL